MSIVTKMIIFFNIKYSFSLLFVVLLPHQFVRLAQACCPLDAAVLQIEWVAPRLPPQRRLITVNDLHFVLVRNGS